MTVKQGSGKKPRKTKVSRGTGVGARPTRLTTIEKALISRTYLASKSAGIKRAIERGRPAPKRSERGAVDFPFFVVLFIASVLFIDAVEADNGWLREFSVFGAVVLGISALAHGSSQADETEDDA
jgi:hypothetical protein